MATRKPLLPLDPEPAPLHGAPPGEASGAGGRSRPRPARERRPGPRRRQRRPSWPTALAAATPSLVTAGLAGLLTTVPVAGGLGLPSASLLIGLVLLIGHVAGRAARFPAWGAAWLVNLVVVTVLFPLLVLHVATARQPYVSLGHGMAAPALLASAGAGLALAGVAVLTAVCTRRVPEQAGLCLLPAVLLVPALVSAPAVQAEPAALGVLATVFLIAAVGAFVGGLAWPGTRLLIAPMVLAGAFVLLWIAGRGPVIHATGGRTALVLGGALVAGAVVLLMVVPLLALWLRALDTPTDAPEAAALGEVRERAGG